MEFIFFDTNVLGYTIFFKHLDHQGIVNLEQMFETPEKVNG